MNLPPCHAGGHARAHQRADRGAGDGDRPDSQFVQRLDDMDMGKAARAATAEGDAEGGAHPLPPPASGGPTIITAGSADKSFFATAFTSSSVTAPI